MNSLIRISLLVGVCATNALGQSKSSSASYELLSASQISGGGTVSNGSNITGEMTVGGAVGGAVSLVTAGGTQEKPNYIGQLYDVKQVTVEATPITIDENGTRQLSASATLDDLTTLILADPFVQWTIILGPISGIDTSGLATADTVFADTLATVQASSQGIAGQFDLTVLNINVDDFGAYAGDQIDDNWQISFFGNPPNPDADPNANPDDDLYNNLVEFLTGYDPTDPGDYFQLEVLNLVGSTATLQLSKIIPGTRYRIERRNDYFSDPWTEFTNFTTLSELFDHQLTDPNAIGPRWFYRVGVEAE